MERNKERAEVTSILKEYGFSGALLKELQQLIVDNDSLYLFYNFIVTEGDSKGMSRHQLVYSFKEQMQKRLSYGSYEEFVDNYSSATTQDQKRKAIGKLIVLEASPEQLDKIIDYFDSGILSLESCYKVLVRYRLYYKMDEIVVLIDEDLRSHKIAT